MFDPSVLSDTDQSKLEQEFPLQRKRLYELDKHSVDELAVYVAHLAATTPPNEDRPRWEVYGWTSLKGPEWYVVWKKKTLLQRILQMEKDDDLRARGKRPKAGYAVPVEVPIKNLNPVQPGGIEAEADPPKRPGAGPVVAPGAT